MWRTAAIVLTAPFWGVACGGDTTPADPGPAGACPKGTDFVRARDVIGPTPAGFEVLAGDRQALGSIAAQFRRAYGATWRGYDAKVLARRNAVNGTAVIVINSHEKTGGGDDFLQGARAAESAAGAEGEPIRVGGKEGRMQRTRDGAFAALAPAGTCAVVMLIADTEELVRSAATELPPR